MPEWRYVLINAADTWVDEWRRVSGDSRATAFRMRDMAYQLNCEDADAILHLYEIGAISAESCKIQLFDFMSDRLKAEGHEPLFEEAGEQTPSSFLSEDEPAARLVRLPGTNIWGLEVS